MTDPTLSTPHQQYHRRVSLKIPIRRLGFAALSVLCLGLSVFLLYSMTLLHFAAGSWAFLQIPAADPRAAAYLDDLVIVLCQVAGGVFLALSWTSTGSMRPRLKWLPLFVGVFCVITWIVALAVAPFHGTH